MAQHNIKRLVELMKADVDPLDANASGVWYEPRSLWTVKGITLADYEIDSGEGQYPLSPMLRVQLNHNDLRNGTRFPITINRIAISGVGYPLTNPDPDMGSSGNLNGTSWINAAKIEISSPFRSDWQSAAINLASLAPQPTSDPEPDDFRNSSLFGTTTLRFDRPLILPKNGAIETSLSSLQGMRWLGSDDIAAFNLPTADLNAFIIFLEKYGMQDGSARSRFLTIRTNQSSAAPQPNSNGYPYLLPPNFGPVTGGSADVPFWDPKAKFDVQMFKGQNKTQAGSTCLYGSTISIDQQDFDTAVIEDMPQASIAPVSSRLGTSIRCVGGPATDFWWRPGAPLALVYDTQTPAAVYWLEQPITLMPGEALDVMVSVPTGETDGAQPIARSSAGFYQLGVAFNGFTAING